uniref:Uncharacterized protein n=1 Tax=Sarcophilus harrisii TaxID=9305 RepID=A0A7N4NW28_SARHA
PCHEGLPFLLLLYSGSDVGPDPTVSVFLGAPRAQNFWGAGQDPRRFPRANHWDLELLTPGNLERECVEEPMFLGRGEDPADPWRIRYLSRPPRLSFPTGHGRVDVAALTVGLGTGLLVLLLAALGTFWYLQRRRQLARNPGSSPQSAFLVIEDLPLTPLPPPPGLPTYEQALAASGVHDAPPPPYQSAQSPRPPGG